MLSSKFKLAAGVGLLSAVVAAGCSGPALQPGPPRPAYETHPEQCIVIDADAGRYQIGQISAISYNFRMGVVTLPTNIHGWAYDSSATIAMNDLAEDGQARAMEMFAKLPPSANCKAPKFGG
ncbi:MAG: hypothetical protein ACAH83_00275 [Alphaproteobacteria bacterium]